MKTVAWLYALASFLMSLFFAWWAIQDAWLASFPNANLSNNHQFWLEVKVLLVILFTITGIVFVVKAIRKSRMNK